MLWFITVKLLFDVNRFLCNSNKEQLLSVCAFVCMPVLAYMCVCVCVCAHAFGCLEGEAGYMVYVQSSLLLRVLILGFEM